MAEFNYPEQAYLFVADHSGFPSTILAYRGAVAGSELEESSFIADIILGDDEVLAERYRSGVYVWEGTIFGDDGRRTHGDDTDLEVHFDGIVRPATIQDFYEFGIRIPESNNAKTIGTKV